MFRFRRYALGVLAGFALLVVAFPVASSAAGVETVSVRMSPAINFVSGGQDVTPPGGLFDNQGVLNVPNGFIYDQTTYVPIRFIANLFNASVTWDGTNHAVDINTQNTAPITQPQPAPTSVQPSSSITVDATPVQFVVNGVNKTPPGGLFNNQNVVEVPDGLIYAQTTYVPIRLVSNLLGEPISWDGNYNSVILGNGGNGTVSLLTLPMSGTADYILNNNWHTGQNMSNADPWYNIHFTMNVDGTQYQTGIATDPMDPNILTNGFPQSPSLYPMISFSLSGQYKYLTFQYGDDTLDQSWAQEAIWVFADGKQVFLHEPIEPSQAARTVTLNVSGVNTISFTTLGYAGCFNNGIPVVCPGVYNPVVDIISPVLFK